MSIEFTETQKNRLTELGIQKETEFRMFDKWRITCSWVGIGFGLERLLMHREKQSGIHRYSKSNVYLDGVCLK